MRKFSVRNEFLYFEENDLFDYLALQIVQANSGVQLKDSFHEKILLIYFWTFSDIHSAHMMPKMIAIDKRYSSTGVSESNDFQIYIYLIHLLLSRDVHIFLYDSR
jgi:hypothetical protein